jgi:hypothetical protein
MRRKNHLLLVGFALIVIFCLHSTITADDWAQKAIFRISQSITLPNHVVLPAGKYVIKRLSTQTPVVQVLNESETKVYATLFEGDVHVGPGNVVVRTLTSDKQTFQILRLDH